MAVAVATADVLVFWHDWRLPILLAFCLATLAVRSFLSRRASRDRVSRSPSPRSPLLKSKVDLVSDAPKLGRVTSVNGLATTQAEVAEREIRVDQPEQSSEARAQSGPRRVKGRRRLKKSLSHEPFPPYVEPANFKIRLMIFYSSLTGSTEKYAKAVRDHFARALAPLSDAVPESRFLVPELLDLSYVDYDDFFINAPKPAEDGLDVRCFYLLLVPTYNIDTVLNTFLDHLQETHHDFRIDTAPLSKLLGYSVFGFGDHEGWPAEEDGFCSQAREVDTWMAKLTGRKRAFPIGLGDAKIDAQARLDEWQAGVLDVIAEVSITGSLGEGVRGSGEPVESGDEDSSNEEEKENPSRLNDLEDLGRTLKDNELSISSEAEPLAVDFTTQGKRLAASEPSIKEMVPKSSPTYTALTKQGYTIVGSHSGVKICRWTKSALRGRGSCYKFSFYGIKSHLCMETTPSLSCSNKCVFCWRHGTNPVGTTWRWQVDPPEMIFEGVKEGHYKKIKMMKGVPGVRAERFAEAMKIRHCALSLVGEPIFYPYINEFTAMLHKEHISSFLVCNAQHPDQLEALKPVTQLYVSIDASNRESLRKIDRPLHRDFWERFQRCLDILREKRFKRRTVFRLTLVKGFNVEDEAEGYADLVQKGLPCFVEVKGVTYCGTSSSAGAGLTMQNVPFYEEVCAFVVALNNALERRGLEYGIAAEHAHSCCILIASKRFYINDKWHTLIDYDRFFELLESGEEFSPEDYVGPPTPEWANWGNGGFNPADERVYRKGKKKDTAIASSGHVDDGE